MEKLVSIYDQIIISKISYEKGDSEAIINCKLFFKRKTIETKLVISQTDLNRIISKIDRFGNGINYENIYSFLMEDGTEIVEYNFSPSNTNYIENFKFNNSFTQISA